MIPSDANGSNGADVRDGAGRFVAGNPGGPGNPNAKATAAWRSTLADAVTADDLGAVLAVLVDQAKAGEPWAVRELLNRCLGKVSERHELSADLDGGGIQIIITPAVDPNAGEPGRN